MTRSNRSHSPTSPNIGPATKNGTPKYQRSFLKTAEASFTKSDSWTSPNIAACHANWMWIRLHQIECSTWLQLHQIVHLPRNWQWNFTKDCNCHENWMCNSIFARATKSVLFCDSIILLRYQSLNSTILLLYYSLTLLVFCSIILWLYYSFTLLFFDSVILLLQYSLTLMFFYSTILLFFDSISLLFYCSLILLLVTPRFFDFTSLLLYYVLLHYSFMSLLLQYSLTLRSRSYTPSFSTKLPFHNSTIHPLPHFATSHCFSLTKSKSVLFVYWSRLDCVRSRRSLAIKIKGFWAHPWGQRTSKISFQMMPFTLHEVGKVMVLSKWCRRLRSGTFLWHLELVQPTPCIRSCLRCTRACSIGGFLGNSWSGGFGIEIWE